MIRLSQRKLLVDRRLGRIAALFLLLRSLNLRFLLATCATILLVFATKAGALTLIPSENEVRIEGLSTEQLQRLSQLTEVELRDAFALYLGKEYPLDSDFAVYIVGTVEFTTTTISFVPRFPFDPDQTYQTVFSLKPIGGALLLEESFQLSTLLMGDEPRVRNIYPSSAQLPANISQLHIQFSEPMNTENIKRYIHFNDAGDSPISALSLITRMEWNSRGDMLTIYFPAKTANNGEARLPATNTNPLSQLTIMNVTISGKLTNSSDIPLRKAVQKPFQLLAEDVTAPDPQNWLLTLPRAGSTEPLEVIFDEPLSYLDMQAGLSIETPAGKTVEGKYLIGTREEAWLFIPEKPWQATPYRLAIKPNVADIAGNTVAKDTHTFGVARPSDKAVNYLPFTPSP